MDILGASAFEIDEVLRGIVKPPVQLEEEKEVRLEEVLDIEVLYAAG